MKATDKKPVILNNLKMTVDPTLDEKYGDKVLFPEKVARAKAFLEKMVCPKVGGNSSRVKMSRYHSCADGNRFRAAICRHDLLN